MTLLRCPHCSSTRLLVLGTAHDPKTESHAYYRRHRKCKACKKNFHTREFIEGTADSLTIEDVRIVLSHLGRAAALIRRRFK